MNNSVVAYSSSHSKTKAFPDFRGRSSGFYFKLAQDDASRMIAFRLSHRVYQTKGYVGSLRTSGAMAPYHARRDTRVLMICTTQHQVVATATLVFERTGRLPGETLFPDAVVPLRERGRSMFEVVRFAIAPEFQGELLITARLLNWAFHYGLIECGCDDLLAEVNPHHMGFYLRLLRFESLAKARPCSRVAGAPAVLLRLRKRVYEQEVLGSIIGGWRVPALRNGLYRRFLPSELWDGVHYAGLEGQKTRGVNEIVGAAE